MLDQFFWREKTHLLLAFFLCLVNVWLPSKESHNIWIGVKPHLWEIKGKILRKYEDRL